MIFNKSTLAYKRLKDLVPMLVDDETGIISYLQELPRQHDMPDFIYYKAEIADTGIFGLQTNRPTGGGTSLDRDKAIAKALGESVERYSSAIYFQDTLTLSTFQDLSESAAHPRLFKLYTPDQISSNGFPLDAFDEHTLTRWASAIQIATGEETLVPAGFVYCPYMPDRSQGEAEIAESVSTGLAAHCSYEEAAINGILEVIERDHFMLHWYAMASCDVIAEDSLHVLHKEMIERFRQFGYEIKILNATADSGIPTVIAVMHGHRKDAVPLVIAAATHLDPAFAVTKSIEELALMERLSRRVMITTRSWSPPGDFTHIRTLAGHLKCWLDPKMIHEADFLISKSNTIELDEIKNISTGSPASDLVTLVRHIENTQHHVYISDITTSDVASLGMHVIRAIVPGYVPLTINHQCRPIGNERLLNFIWEQHQTQQSQAVYINPLPHPFA